MVKLVNSGKEGSTPTQYALYILLSGISFNWNLFYIYFAISEWRVDCALHIYDITLPTHFGTILHMEKFEYLHVGT